MLDHEIGLLFQRGKILTFCFTAQHEDEIDAGVLGQQFIRSQSIPHHDHFIVAETFQ